MKTKVVVVISMLVMCLSNMAHAGLITSAASATASSSVGPDYDIGNAIDQSGLSVGYTSGVTDFATYIASNPTHDYLAVDNEWFSVWGDVNATVVFDMGSVLNLLNLALWNEEFSGFGQAIISASVDNVSYSALTTINPVDSPPVLDYGAQVFALGVSARFLKFELSGCPQQDGADSPYCGIGEVAFDVGDRVNVPEPNAILLFGLGLVLIGFRRARKN